MNLTWAALDPHKILSLFKRANHDENARTHRHLFPLVPPLSTQLESRSRSTAIDRLILRTHGTTAKPVLCSHTVTVTATSDVVLPEAAKSAEDEVLEPTDTSRDTIGTVIEPANKHVADTNGRNTASSPISSISTAGSPVEADLTGKILKTFTADDQDDVQDHRTIKSIGSVEHTNISHRNAVIDTPDTSESIVSNKDDDPVKLGQASLSRENAIEVAEKVAEHQSSALTNDEEDEEDDCVDPEVLRADWVPLEAITNELFRAVLQQHLPGGETSMDQIRYTDGVRGGNSIARFLEVDDGMSIARYIVKVPCTGTPARWQDSDAYMLRNDARTMMYIRKHTDVPCPEVLDFDDSLDNVLGAPYIIMRAIEGIPSNRVWFDQDEDGDDDEINAGLPDESRMRIRVKILRSLAICMAKLQALEFDSAGTLNFDDDPENPKIGPTYHWRPTSEMQKLSIHDLSTPKCIDRIPVHKSSKSYFMAALNENWPRRDGWSAHVHNGRRSILETTLSHPPFSESKKVGDTKQTFVLRHDDLDFQNILCDEDGNVTGIIDWDKCRATPRCLGFSSLPAFLVKDWAPDYSSLYATHQPWELVEYRNVYACAILEATGPNGDGRYTINSAIYEAVNAALYGGHNGGSVGNLVRHILKCLATTRMFDDKDVLSHLGEGWDIGEMKIGAELKRFIEPQSHVEAVEPWFWVDPDN